MPKKSKSKSKPSSPTLDLQNHSRPSTSLSNGGTGPFDDLTPEEKLSLLKSEFDQLNNECLDDVFKSFDYDYETTRSVIQELFPSVNSPGGKPGTSVTGNEDDLIGDENSLISGTDLFLEINPVLFARLQNQYSDSTDYDCLPSIARDFETQGSLLLPLDHSVASALYRNIIQFVRRSNSALEPDEGILDQDPVSLKSIGNSEESRNLKEIMELEAALKASREEYMQDLSRLAISGGGNDAAISQELTLEKKRMFLAEKFPGVNEQHLSHLFEINCFNLNETIKDIEAIYSFKLPNYYRHSLYCEIIKRSNSDSGVASESTLSDEEEDEDPLGHDGLISNDKEFTAKVQNLFEERKMCHVRIAHLRQKSAHFNFRKQPHASMLYQQEIARCNLQMKQISDNIVQTYVSYGHPNNSVDLHGLIMKEVHSILPEMLRRKQASLVQIGLKRVKFKIITGIGSSANGTGLIRNYLVKFVLKNNIKFQSDGPGAFILSLSARNLIDL